MPPASELASIPNVPRKAAAWKLRTPEWQYTTTGFPFSASSSVRRSPNS